MKDLTFFSALKDILRCGACGNTNCGRRYQPNTRVVLYHDGFRKVDYCPKADVKNAVKKTSMA